MPELLGIEYEGMPSGPGPGAINGHSAEQILGHIRDVARSEAGVIYYGSIGSRFNQGNSGNVYDHDPVTGETLNSFGLPEIGIDDAEPIIAEASRICEDNGKVFIVSSSSLAGQKAAEVLPEVMERVAEAGGEHVRQEANFSCPNIVTEGGGRKPIVAYDPEAILETRAAIFQRMGIDFLYVEKLSPYIGDNRELIPEVTGLYTVRRRIGNVAVCGFNTVPGQSRERDGKPVLRFTAVVNGEEVVSHAGGLSGPAMSGEMYQLHQEFVSQLPDDITFIAANGVMTGRDVMLRTTGPNGAAAAVGVTAYMEGEKAGRSYGRTASLIAEEYYQALEEA